MTINPRRSGADYSEALASLLPTGPAWPREPETVLMQLMRGVAAVWGRIDARAHDLLDVEAFPDTATERLTDWEFVAGLPEECYASEPLSVSQRRARLLDKLTGERSLARSYYIGLANSLGHPDAAITEFSPFRAGRSRCGSTRWRTGSPLQRFGWRLYVGPAEHTYFRAGRNRAGRDPHLIWVGGDKVLECLVNLRKPAHTRVRLEYSKVV